MATPALRIRIAPKFPAKVQSSAGIGVTRSGGTITIRQDWSTIQETADDIDTLECLVRNVNTGEYYRTPVPSVAAEAGGAKLTNLAPWIGINDFPTIIQNAREKVNLTDDRSVDRTGAEDVSARAIAAVQYLNSRGGGKLVIPYGNFKVAASIQAGTIGTGDIEVEWEAGGNLIAAAGLAHPVLDLRPSSSVMTDRRLILTNPRIDCSAGDSPSGGGQYCVAIAVQYYRNVEILNPDLYGGEDPANLNCDSLITGVANDSMLIDGGRLRGGNDSGVYVNADNDGATTSVVRIIGTHISRCKDAVSAKRDLALLAVNGATIEECVAGIVGTYVPAGDGQPYTPPPRLMEISDTTFRKVTANVVRFTGPTKGRIADCTIEDWGYFNFDGTGSAGSDAIAIRLYGASGLSIQNNRIGLRYWNPDQHICVYSQNETLDGTPYTAGANHFSGNTYGTGVKTVPTAISEASGINPSTYLNEVFNDVTTPVGGFFGASGSLISYTNVGSKRQFVRAGNSVVPLTRGLMTTSTSNATLTAPDSGGTYRNDGATSRVDYTLPAAAEGLEYSFIVSDGDGIRVQAVGDDVIYIGNSASTAAGYAQSTVAISTLTLRAINTTLWVATAQTGTWTVA